MVGPAPINIQTPQQRHNHRAGSARITLVFQVRIIYAGASPAHPTRKRQSDVRKAVASDVSQAIWTCAIGLVHCRAVATPARLSRKLLEAGDGLPHAEYSMKNQTKNVSASRHNNRYFFGKSAPDAPLPKLNGRNSLWLLLPHLCVGSRSVAKQTLEPRVRQLGAYTVRVPSRCVCPRRGFSARCP